MTDYDAGQQQALEVRERFRRFNEARELGYDEEACRIYIRTGERPMAAEADQADL